MVFTLLIMLIISSCKKNAGPFTVIPEKINSVTIKGTNNMNSYAFATDKYTYDTQGRPTLRTVYDSTGAYIAKATYTYADSILVELYFSANSTTPYFADTFRLNPQGYVSGFKGETYLYDSSGYLVSRIVPGITETYGYVDGNFISSSNNGSMFGTTLFATDQKESRAYGYAYITFYPTPDYGIATLFGKSNTNLLTTDIYHITDTIFHSYQFDNKGRVSVETIKSNTGIENETLTFSYFD